METRKLFATFALLLVVFFTGCKKDEYLEKVGLCPVVVSTIPAKGATGVPLNQVVSATFNEKMNSATINQSSFTLKGAALVAGTITYNGVVASFTPSSPLTPNTTYTGTVTTMAKDLMGNAIQQDYGWTFSTDLSPTVISTDPANTATGVLLNKTITANFSVPMDPLSITGATYTIKQGTTNVPGVVTYAGTMASFTPSAPLTPNSIYTGTITTGAKNASGSPLISDYIWTFTAGAAPTVISTDPANAAIGVVLNKIVNATFSVPMNPLTITSTTYTLKQGANLVAGTVTYTGTTASFSPLSPLSPNTVYTGTITTGAINLTGIPMSIDYVWTFSTGALPAVISTDPLNSATNVILNKIVMATFNVPMDPLTLTASTFTLKQGSTLIPGAVAYTGSSASFTPTINLLPGLTYTATVTTGAKSPVGIPMASDYVWTFNTGAAPSVTATDPVNLVTGVVLSKLVSATFSTAMDPLTITASTFTLKQGATAIAGTVSYTGTAATFNPAIDLVSGLVYTGTITTGAKSSAANIPLASNYVWTFTTGSAPTVTATDPANLATGVVLNKTVSATFSMAMDPLTITGTTFVIKQGSTTIPGTVSYTGTTATFNPTSDFVSGMVYTATVTTGAKSGVSSVPLAADYVWTFTTGSAPTVTATDPLNLATGIALNKTVTANFSMAMDPLTITGTTFTVKQGLTTVAGTVSYLGTTATFNPTSDFTSGMVYTATITTGAKSSASSVPLAANYVWTFTTGSAPTVTATDPANLATGVALNKIVTASFNMAMDPLTISGTTFTVKQGLTTVAGTVSYTGTTATFNPTGDFEAGLVYTATVTTGAKSSASSVPLAVDYVWTFTTGSDPTVTATDPANLATGIALNKTVTANFSMAMDPLTITGTTFTVKQGLTTVAGTVSYLGTTATFNPTSDFTAGMVYTATVTTGAKSSASNIPLAVDYVWTFTTGSAPTVTATDPANLATGIALNKIVTASFSMAMDPLTITGTTFTVKQGSTTVLGAVSYTGTTASFNPTSDLVAGLVYTATVTTGAKSSASSVPIASNYVWTFTTGSAPTVTVTDPVNLATGVALNKTVTASFSMAMDPLTITGTTFTVKQGATSVLGAVSYTGSTATFNPTSDLVSGMVYTATITTGAKSSVGSTPLTSDYVWIFTTGLAPTVTATDPANLATGVALNKTVTATFSMAMDPLTISGTTFTVKQGLSTVAGNVSYAGTTASFNPTSDFVAGTVYTATVTTGAKSNGANIPLASNHVWSFTTLNPPLFTSIFGAFGGNAGITNQGLNTVINNGSIGTTAASTLVTGFHDGTTAAVYTETPLNAGLVTGRIYTAPPAPGDAVSAAIAANGLLAAQAAYLSISPASKPGGIDPGAGELGGLTLAPGIYKSASGTFNISNGNLTLDAQGDPNAEWIFQTSAGLTVGIAGPAGARSVILIGGALAKNVYWYVGSAATINGAGGGIMTGTIISTAGVTFSTAGNAVQTVLNGRAISLVASVTMVNTTINVPLP